MDSSPGFLSWERFWFPLDVRNTEHVTTTHDALTDRTTFTYKDPVSGLSLAIRVYDKSSVYNLEESCFYELSFLDRELLCLNDGGSSICWWHDDATGYMITGTGYLEFHDMERLRIKTRIIMIEGHRGPIIEIHSDVYDRDDWGQFGTLARDQYGRYRLFREDDTRWLKWNGLVVDSHVK
jgi:hypothetical protein